MYTGAIPSTYTGGLPGAHSARSLNEKRAARRGPLSDPFWDKCILALSCEGANGSTTFTDLSPKARGNATVNGTPQVATATSKWGNGSLLFNGSSSLTFPASSDFDLRNVDFTYRFFFRPASTAAQYLLQLSSTHGMLAHIPSATNTFYHFTWDAGPGGHPASLQSVVVSNLTDGNFHHFQAGKRGMTFYVFIDGRLAGTKTVGSTNDLYAGTFSPNIGYSGGTNSYSTGHLQDLVVYRGVCTHTQSFTPPTIPLSALRG